MKTLGKQEVEYIKKLHAAGKSYEDIATILHKQEYRTQYGKALCSGAISNFMIANGYRNHYKKRRRTSAELAALRTGQAPVTATPVSEDFMLDVIANKSLSKTQKLKVLTALLED